ncbi:MAG: hypothetical protein B6D70_03385 [gamma proteobacterium symbiont of Stewartia floridana]|nr:MAG: hypothetical protein B6D76_15090 [gamma proteobacterium symbiont of Stewartia floridana]RLW57691.1 MAG: hypothetical protein B6D75_16265 [gamma proteobacterium symbiont of Stewartia floridana]RLW66586.1 MAG: hypothetical protein B6D73_02355 [gamma proteobacterium symbiont of Stewartia floridana]RLW66630.1 MAG: hypothetical protein B6D70_03385 [gamma proteobacterium symbiont of Stewartia floridana]
MLLSIFGYPKSTEHPHKLPNLIVKELLKFSLEKDRLFYSAGCLCQEKTQLFSSWSVMPGLFESAYSTARKVIVNNYLNYLLHRSFYRISVAGKADRGGALYVDLSNRQLKFERNFNDLFLPLLSP